MTIPVEKLKTNKKLKNKIPPGVLLENKRLINENKKLLKKLKQAESIRELFGFQTELINSTNIFLSFIDKEYRYVIVNDRWCEFVGRDRKDVIGKKISLFWGRREFNNEIKPRLDKALKGDPVNYQHILKSKNGDERFFDIIFHPFYDNKSITGVLAASVDITERKKAEEKLKEVSEIFRLFLKYNPIYVYIKDENLRPIYLSDNFTDLVPLPINEMIGKSTYELFPSEFSKKLIKDDKKILSEGKPFELIEEFNGRTYSTLKFPIIIDGNTKYLAGYTTDITERINSEKEISLKNELLHLTSEMGKIGGWEFYTDTMQGTWSDEVARIHDLDPSIPTSVAIGTSFYTHESKIKIEHAIKEVIENAKPYDLELEMITAAGNHKYVRTMGMPVIKNNKVVKVQGIFQDITEDKEIRKKLELEMKRMQTLIETMPDPIWVKDPEGVYLLCNPAYENLFGYKSSEIIGKTDYDIVPKVVADLFRENDLAALKENKPTTYFEEVKFVGNNRKAFFESIKTPLHDAEGKLIGTLGIGREITKLIEINNELQEGESRYRHLFEQNPAPMLIYERGSLNMLAVNEAFENHYGYSRKEILSMDLTDLYPEEEKDQIVKVAAGLSGYQDVGEWHHCRKDGSIIAIIARSNDLIYEGHSARVAVITDVTERKIAEEKIKSINIELEQRVAQRTEQLATANKDLESFAYSISHDLRAPLRHIDGFTRLLKNSLTKENEDTIRYCNKITESSVKMASMIDALLTFSKLGRKPLQKSEIDLNVLVANVIKHFDPDIENRNIEWRISSLPAFYGDANLMQLVFENLISNAIKFTSKKDKAVIEIGISDTPKGKLCFYVKDNGAGFDNSYADKLFGVFQRLHTAEEFEGTGIGLANIKQIINKHGGTIRAEGEVDKGATFYITF